MMLELPTGGRPYVRTGGDLTAADVAFAQQMIGHHRQAIDLAMTAKDRSNDAAVDKLADGIAAARRADIEALAGQLSAWEGATTQDPVATTAAPSPGGEPGAVVGADELARLRTLSGIALNRLLLGLLIEHNREAISIVGLQQEAGQNSLAREIADGIETGQSAEITIMQTLLSAIGAPL